MNTKPSSAFIGASWFALAVGMIGFFIGIFNSGMILSEKGYYFTVIILGLFSVISVQKTVRDRMENIPVTDLYYAISWFCVILSIVLLVIGLWHSKMLKSEIGTYAFSFVLALFGAIAVQKNTRDSIEKPNS